eukprot:31268-Eustigmatos_ZCMA.PRE.1
MRMFHAPFHCHVVPLLRFVIIAEARPRPRNQPCSLLPSSADAGRRAVVISRVPSLFWGGEE